MNDIATTFRDVMADVCTPVSVVTSMDGDRPHGTTVSAFASLSMTPPMVLVSLDRGSDLLAVVQSTNQLGVNILASDQHGLALQFARKGANKFTGVGWSTRRGVPRLDGVSGWLACDVADLVPGGDHILALCTVVDAQTQPTGLPLTYRSRAFGTHTPLPT